METGRAQARRRWHWALVPLTIFSITRLLDAVFLWVGAHEQTALPATSPAYTVNFPTENSPGYWGVVSNWDGQWYRSIAESGYPTSLPTEDGEVAQNEWAFYPAYPMLVRALMMLTNLPFGPAATIVSLACSGLAVLTLYRLLLQTGDRFVALATVLCLCTYPTAPVFQVGYSEGLALLLIVLSISCLHHRRYGWVTALMLAVSLTRPLVLPFAVVIGVHWIVRWRRARVDPFPWSQRLACAGSALTAAASVTLWPLIAAVGTGQRDAFTATQSAWPANQNGHGLWANWVLTAVSARSAGLAAAVVVVLAGVGFVVSRPGARKWGLELGTWSLAYPLYLLFATRPTPSFVRYFMLAVGPLWPLPACASPQETKAQRTARWCFLIAIAVLGVIGQYFWVTRVFTIAQAPEVQPYP